MTTNLLIIGVSTGPLSAAGNTVAHVGVSSGGTANTPYAFTGNADPHASIGDGKVSEFVAQQLRCARPPAGVIACLCANQIAGSIGTVTQSPSGGPLITVTGTPVDHYDLRVKVARAGAVGVAGVSVALDGGSYDYAFDVPDEAPGASIGSVDLTTLTLSTLNGLTVLSTAETGGLKTTTITTPATVAAFLAQIQTAVGAAQIVSLSQGKYLKITSATKGTASTLTIGAGTANTILGLTAAANTGAGSTIALPFTGLTLTFPSSSAYVATVVYSCTVASPKAGLSDILAAMDALYATYQANPFTVVQIDVDPADGAELHNWTTQIAAKLLGWQTGTPRVYCVAIIGSPLGATGPSGIAANDIDVRNAMAGYTDQLVTVAHGDGYLTGSKVLGSFRRSVVQELGIRCAGQSLSQDPGNAEFNDPSTGTGALPEISLRGPDGVTLARDENTATTKMGGSEGPGFSVVKTKGDGGIYFVSGVTRAGPTSVFRDLGTLRMVYFVAFVVSQLLESKENATRQLQPNGTLRPSDAAAINGAWTRVVQGLVVTNATPHASAASVNVDPTEVVATTRDLTATFDVQALGQIKSVTGIISVSALTIS